MKKTMGIVVGIVLLLLVVSGGNLFADEYLKKNGLGIKYNNLMPNDNDQFSSGNGFGLYGVFDLAPKSKSPNRACVEFFIDKVSLKAKTDVMSKGVLSTNCFGFSILYAYRSKSSTFYLGGGFASYTNKFKIDSATVDGYEDDMDDFFWYYLGEVMLEFSYDEEVKNATGLHLKGGFDIDLSKSSCLLIEVKKTMVKAKVSGEWSALTYDGVDFWEYEDEASDKIKMGSLSFNLGFSLRF